MLFHLLGVFPGPGTPASNFDLEFPGHGTATAPATEADGGGGHCGFVRLKMFKVLDYYGFIMFHIWSNIVDYGL